MTTVKTIGVDVLTGSETEVRLFLPGGREVRIERKGSEWTAEGLPRGYRHLRDAVENLQRIARGTPPA